MADRSRGFSFGLKSKKIKIPPNGRAGHLQMTFFDRQIVQNSRKDTRYVRKGPYMVFAPTVVLPSIPTKKGAKQFISQKFVVMMTSDSIGEDTTMTKALTFVEILCHAHLPQSFPFYLRCCTEDKQSSFQPKSIVKNGRIGNSDRRCIHQKNSVSSLFGSQPS